jgi:multiple sugar transport system substrate-binding protein
MNKKVWLLCLIAVCVALSGCATAPNSPEKTVSTVSKQGESKKEEPKPVTLKMLTQVSLSDLYLNLFFIEPLKKKYPYITLERIQNGPDSNIQTLITSGDIPDIILAGYQGVGDLKPLNILQDMNDYVKKYNFDVNRYDPQPIDTIKRFSDKGELYGLPYAFNFAVNYYNKDIFDKFGVPYPKDGMTWDETIELSRQLTREDGGTHYHGLVPGVNPERINAAVGYTYVDPKTFKATLNNDNWKKILNVFNTVYHIPGYSDGNPGNTAFSQAKKAFLNDQTLAMFTEWSDVLTDITAMQDKGQSFNWDMVTFPNFKERLGYSRHSGAHMMFLTNASKHKEDAFLVISYMGSDEVQNIVNRMGRLPALKKTDEMKKSFGADNKALAGKNVNAVFGTKLSDLPATTDYDKLVWSVINNPSLMQDVVEKGLDINTVLRDAEEKANALIAPQLEGAK